MKALILVDPQNDFMPGGALAVPHGDEVVAVANRLVGRFDHVIATQDWHPADHLSFSSQHAGRSPGDVIDLEGLEQVLWPDHCIQDTRGAELHAALDVSSVNSIFRKGTERSIDSYSAFFDNAHRRATGLGDHLAGTGVDEVYLMGLATDYCVKFSALDAVGLGLKTHVIRDGCRGIDLQPGDVDRALREMAAMGVKLVCENEL
jgi:nicotinamidase/pyrazinamidase